MKTKKLLRKIAKHLNADRRAQLAKVESLKKVLRNLAAKEKALKRKLAEEENADRRSVLDRKIKVIRAQREKGVELHKALKAVA